MGNSRQNVRKWLFNLLEAFDPNAGKPLTSHQNQKELPVLDTILYLKKVIRHIALFIALMLPLALWAQSNVSFEAYSDAKQVLLNNYFEVSFTLKNANGTDFNPPDFKGFQILSGPNSSTSMQIINGNVSREMGYSFTLQPTAVGNFTIGSASIKANGKKISTEPLSIEVLKGEASRSGTAKTNGEIFVKLEPSKKETYVGEQISLDFKLYTTVSIDGYEIMEEPEYRGFYAQEMRRFNSSTQREVIGGKQYTTKVLRRIALFPQQTGQLTISPAKFQLAVLEEGDRTGFFFSRNIRPVFYTTEPLNIEVKPLPIGTPENFSGAVGNYEFQSSVNRNMVTTDDAISVTMLISGTGDVKRVQAPALVLSDSFEIYPPKTIEEQMSENQGLITGKKIVEYLILPKYPGEYMVSPEFTYFSPTENEYISLSSGPYPINVRQGSDKHSSANVDRSDKDQNDDIQFIKLRTDYSRNGSKFVGSGIFWAITSLPIICFIGLLFYKKSVHQKENLDILSYKRKLANKEAQRRLETAKQYMVEYNSRAFHDEVSKASLGYICDKLNIPISQLSKDNVKTQLQFLKIEESLIEEFMKILQTCEMALFAGIANTSTMQNTYEKAVTIIAEIEERIESSKT